MSKVYGNEAEFSSDVAQFLRDMLESAKIANIHVAERLKILKDFTISKDREDKWRLLAGLQQQDIVLFAPTDRIAMNEFMSPVMRIDKYDRTGETPITIPLAICELKLGSNFVTHAFITYSSISAQIKNIFPHCAYYFVLDSNKLRGVQPETVSRQTKGFDRVFLNWSDEKEKVWDTIQAHLVYLSERGILKS